MAGRLSKAAVQMRQKLSPPVMNQADLAKELGVTQQAVSAWLKGRAMPEPERMLKIEKVLGIKMQDWVEPAEGVPPVTDSTKDLDADKSGEVPAVTDADVLHKNGTDDTS